MRPLSDCGTVVWKECMGDEMMRQKLSDDFPDKEKHQYWTVYWKNGSGETQIRFVTNEVDQPVTLVDSRIKHALHLSAILISKRCGNKRKGNDFELIALYNNDITFSIIINAKQFLSVWNSIYCWLVYFTVPYMFH